MSIEIATAKRLVEYSPTFDTDVIITVIEHAARQASYDSHYDYIQDSIGVDLNDWAKDTPILDHQPDEYDSGEVLCVYLPLQNPLNGNQLTSLASIAATNPNKRLIAQANPAGRGANPNTLDRADRQRVAHKSDFRPMARPLVEYAAQTGVERVHLYGPSFGTDLVAAAIDDKAFDTVTATLLDPVSIKLRRRLPFLLDFLKAGKRLDEYVDAPGLAMVRDAHEESYDVIDGAVALLRHTNRANVDGMKKGALPKRLHQAMRASPETVLTVAWGEASELAVHSLMQSLMVGLNRDFGDRVFGMSFAGQGHALGSDNHLQDAVVLQGIKNGDKEPSKDS